MRTVPSENSYFFLKLFYAFFDFYIFSIFPPLQAPIYPFWEALNCFCKRQLYLSAVSITSYVQSPQTQRVRRADILRADIKTRA